MNNAVFTINEVGSTVSGVVIEFDKHIGLGKIKLDDNRILDFHTINIEDGTRGIDVGAKISGKIFFHPRGRYEIKKIEKI